MEALIDDPGLWCRTKINARFLDRFAAFAVTSRKCEESALRNIFGFVYVSAMKTLLAAWIKGGWSSSHFRTRFFTDAINNFLFSENIFLRSEIGGAGKRMFAIDLMKSLTFSLKLDDLMQCCPTSVS